MSSDLDFENQKQQMNSETISTMSIDQDGEEWDISLFDELDNLGDAEDLFQALEQFGYPGDAPELDFDIDLPSWSTDASSTHTDGDLSMDSLSPAHTLSSVPSPASLEALSPYSIQDDLAISSQNLPSPAFSVSSESSGFSEPPLAKRAPKRTSQARQAKQAQPVKRPIQLCPKVSIQPRPVLTTVPLAQTTTPLQTKTLIIQPLQTAMLPHSTVVKQAPVSIQPAPPIGHPLVLAQPAQVLHIQTPQAVTRHLVTFPAQTQDRPASITTPPSLVSVPLNNPGSDDDSKVSQRQQRMIKNRESASQSRKKKKEYLLALEARLKMALYENEALKNENGTLKKQLEGLLSENTVLKTSAGKRRAVCLMVVLVFLMLNVGPIGVFESGQDSKLQAGSMHSGRHLLGFSPVPESPLDPETLETSQTDSSEDKALMVVKEDPLFFRNPPPCQPPVNRTKCIKLNHELRGWVHRHEVERTKSRRMTNSQHRATRAISKEDKKSEVGQVVTVQYADSTEEKLPGSELQVYYAPHRTYNDFFDEIHRRGDTFYVVSFRRDHLLLPATSHNKGSRPKMSVVLPAMNINDSVIKDKEYEVMMQIDCEVTDTRILHIKSSSIPPFLRVNRTDTLYPPSPADSQAMPPVQVLMGSA
ncbi:cyclic AMP-dependent transcription factor ATF-6 alpha isoform X2 [Esox lucius]|uniref:BZIP domain-containing protein n=1 Tax=Esox lucius TaxID=8010 RepID=A0A3P8ZXZ4_ESOLU|nr:cyclic AMP-dependent transcription factor ATF-6 alpha isoform X3 [Esox lucius]XP_034149662.1 cyclic AMP-dependent transcription factor ATF-6 alpha isoform X2 [Esox lucius]